MTVDEKIQKFEGPLTSAEGFIKKHEIQEDDDPELEELSRSLQDQYNITKLEAEDVIATVLEMELV